jgi:hypothetical protein
MPVFSFGSDPIPEPPPVQPPNRSQAGALRRGATRRTPPRTPAPLAYMLLGAGLSVGFQNVFRHWNERASPQASGLAPPSPTGGRPEQVSGTKPATPMAIPFTATAPSTEHLRTFLQEWLGLKGLVLAGKPSPRPLAGYATGELVEALTLQRREALGRGLSQRTLARVEHIEVLERSGERVVIAARIRYTDETLAGNGTVVKRTPLLRLRNTYEFRRIDGFWKLAAWSQSEAGTPLPTLEEPMQTPFEPDRGTTR